MSKNLNLRNLSMYFKALLVLSLIVPRVLSFSYFTSLTRFISAMIVKIRKAVSSGFRGCCGIKIKSLLVTFFDPSRIQPLQQNNQTLSRGSKSRPALMMESSLMFSLLWLVLAPFLFLMIRNLPSMKLNLYQWSHQWSHQCKDL